MEAQRLVSVLKAVKEKQIDAERKKYAAKQKRSAIWDKIFVGVLTALFATPIYTAIFGLILMFIFVFLGWEQTDENMWTPFIVAIPFSLTLCIYYIVNPPEENSKQTKHYKIRGNSRDFGDGWYPGCPEDRMYSSQNRNYDFDGDGRMSHAESSTKFDIFFGDDE